MASATFMRMSALGVGYAAAKKMPPMKQTMPVIMGFPLQWDGGNEGYFWPPAASSFAKPTRADQPPSA